MIERPPPPPLVGLFMLSLFVTCDLLWSVKWEFHKGSGRTPKRRTEASFVAPRPHDDTLHPADYQPLSTLRRHFSRSNGQRAPLVRIANSCRQSLTFAIDSRANRAPELSPAGLECVSAPVASSFRMRAEARHNGRPSTFFGTGSPG